MLDDAADAGLAIIDEGLFAGRRQADVDLAFVARIDAAGDERPVAVFQSSNDARHLRGQYAQHALNVAHNHAFAVVEDGERQELDFLEVGNATASTQGGQADLRNDFE